MPFEFGDFFFARVFMRCYLSMMKSIRPIVLLALLFASNLPDRAQEPSIPQNPIFQTFAMWGSAPTDAERFFLYVGFTNGFFSAPSTDKGKTDFGDCIMKNIPTKQAVAMINKYYKDNPQRWSTPLTLAIIEALTVKDGPCPNINPWAR
jgi:hypothetical protein